MEKCALYIHFPFCKRRCSYCDFVSTGGMEHRIPEYLQDLCREIRTQALHFARPALSTIYIGGGTPSLLTGEQMQQLMDTVRSAFPVSDDAEISMEANPGTLDAGKLKGYRSAGINRLSIGVQSFDSSELRMLGRIHTQEEAAEAVRLAAACGFDNINVDLMYALPGQKEETLLHSVRLALSLPVSHLSLYSLILEEGTVLTREVESGRTPEVPDDDAVLAMEKHLREILADAGFERYEVSNYARPGKECRHNLFYWECLPYIGVGCGAHSDMHGRFSNPDTLDAWKQCIDRADREKEGDGSIRDRMFERVMMGLRMVKGVDGRRFREDFGKTLDEAFPESMEEIRMYGLGDWHGERFALTGEGMNVMNTLLVRMMEEADV